MKITLAPQRRDDAITIAKAGDLLTINGEPFDFSTLPDGATIPSDVVPCQWIVGEVHRIAGVLELTVILPLGPNPPIEAAFPAPIINPPDGVIALPGTQEVAHVDA
ncbi:MAG: hypothetical protein DI589_27220 [Shinella sp.]|nr:MAG: hypothetical protein DI589_27220 [Shinella sp.]